MDYQKKYQILQKKLKAANELASHVRQVEQHNIKLKDQNAALQNQLKFSNNLLHLKYKEIQAKEQNLISAENALIQKDATIQQLQSMLRKFIVGYGEIFPKDIVQQESDQPSENYYITAKIEILEQRIKNLQEAMEYVNTLKPQEFKIFWQVTKENGNN